MISALFTYKKENIRRFEMNAQIKELEKFMYA